MIKHAIALKEWQRRAAALSPDALELLTAVINAAHDAVRMQAVLAAADPAATAAAAAVMEAFKEEERT